jgi:adenosylcobinamide amidohydrolase
VKRHVRFEDGEHLPLLAWSFPAPLLAASTASSGGGIGERSWVLNAQVSHDYGRHDLDAHAAELAAAIGLSGPGVTMLTAADVDRVRQAQDRGVTAAATVGLTHPTWAAAPDDPKPPGPGTINVVVIVPVRLGHGALLNALCTATEAKSQALFELGFPATGTPSDAVTVLCPTSGPEESFCGPRSVWGARLARAVYSVVR